MLFEVFGKQAIKNLGKCYLFGCFGKAMKPFFLLLKMILLCCLPLVIQAQNFTWAKGEGGIGNDLANAITTDEQGNSYITGNLAGMANFSGQVVQGQGLYDAVLLRYDAAGNINWIRTAGGKGNDEGDAIKYKDGYVYVAGRFEDSALFSGTGMRSAGSSDVFIAKYETNGNLVWVRKAGGSKADYPTAIDVDADGNVYVAGSYETAITIDAVTLNTTNLYGESFYAKYDASGNLQWAKSATGNNFNLLTGLACDANGAVVVTGFFGGNFKLQNTALNAQTASFDIFLAKLDGSGNLQWLKRAGGSFEDEANAICVDGQGNIFITGYFAGTAYFDANSVTYQDYSDVFVAKYDGNGNNLWARDGNGAQLDAGYAIAADAVGNVYATGMFQNTADFDGHILTGDFRDIFLVSYSPSGQLRWITSAGGGDTDCGLGVSVKPDGTVSLCGFYRFTCSFGTINVDVAEDNDMFIADFNPPLVDNIESVSSLSLTISPSICAACPEILLTTAGEDKKQVELYASSGQLLMSTQMEYALNISVACLPRGIYYIHVTGTGAQTVRKVVLQ